MKSIIALGVTSALLISGIQGYAMESMSSSMMMKADVMVKTDSMSMNQNMRMDISKQ